MELLEKLQDLKRYHQEKTFQVLSNGIQIPVRKDHLEFYNAICEIEKELKNHDKGHFIKVLSDETVNEIDLLLLKLKEIDDLLKKINR